MTNTLLQQGLDLMIYGMGTVFVFLTLLVIAITLMSTIIRRLLPEVTPPGRTPHGKLPDQRLMTIIKLALDQHRQRQK